MSERNQKQENDKILYDQKTSRQGAPNDMKLIFLGIEREVSGQKPNKADSGSLGSSFIVKSGI